MEMNPDKIINGKVAKKLLPEDNFNAEMDAYIASAGD